MLAKPTKAISEVLDRFEGKQFTCEYKYDGERAQIHYMEDGKIRVFSRNSEDMTVKYPEFVTQLPRVSGPPYFCAVPSLPADSIIGRVQCIKEGTKSFVIDAEAVAWDAEEKRLLEFQKLTTRKRKDVKAEDIKVKVHLFAFDLLYLNGEVGALSRRETPPQMLVPLTDASCSGDSRSWRRTCEIVVSSCASTCSPSRASSRSPSRTTPRRSTRSRSSSISRSRTDARGSWSRCSRAKARVTSRVDAVFTGSRYVSECA